MKKQRAALVTVLAGSVLLSACATGPDRKPGDPMEPMNRAIYSFNSRIDTAIAQPVARGYQKVTPSPLRQAISNFFSNFGDIDTLANDVLQLKFTAAAEDLMRIAINTTFGVGGLFDVATEARLPRHHQDFGLTMGRWGVPPGPYLVLPLFGPSSLRDAIGRGVDVKFNVLGSVTPAIRNPLYGVQFVSTRSDMLGATDLLSQAALDPYSFVRDAYVQQRQAAVQEDSTPNNAAPPSLPDYGDPGDTENTANTTNSGAKSDSSGSSSASVAQTVPAPAKAQAASATAANAPAAAASAPTAAMPVAASAPDSAPVATPRPAAQTTTEPAAATSKEKATPSSAP